MIAIADVGLWAMSTLKLTDMCSWAKQGESMMLLICAHELNNVSQWCFSSNEVRQIVDCAEQPVVLEEPEGSNDEQRSSIHNPSNPLKSCGTIDHVMQYAWFLMDERR